MEINVYVVFNGRFIACGAPHFATDTLWFIPKHSSRGAEHHPASDIVQQQLFKEDNKKKDKKLVIAYQNYVPIFKIGP